MNIAIFTDDARLTGSLCQVWQELFTTRGDRASFEPMWFGDEAPMVPPDDVDINLIVAGQFLIRWINKHGLPARGKNILWMIDPCPEDEAGAEHRKKAAPRSHTPFARPFQPVPAPLKTRESPLRSSATPPKARRHFAHTPHSLHSATGSLWAQGFS